MTQKTTIYDWIELRKFRGHYTFAFSDVRAAFSAFSLDYLRLALSRQIAANVLINPSRGFYVIVPTEYALGAGVPPTFYIDQMMGFLNRDYYVGLLNAAELHGAAHQRPQAFTVVNTPPSIRDGIRSSTQFHFIMRQGISTGFIEKRQSRLGTINISTPEVTMLDLVMFEDRVGGLNRACTVLSELLDAADISRISDETLKAYPSTVCQRLGYIIDSVLDEADKADAWYVRLKEAGIKFRKTPFNVLKPIVGCPTNRRWSITVNQEIEIDE